MGFPGGGSDKEHTCQCRRHRRHEFNPCQRLRTSLGGEHGNSLKYSCLGNPMDRGAGGLWSLGSQRVWHNWSDLVCKHAIISIDWLFVNSVLNVGIFALLYAQSPKVPFFRGSAWPRDRTRVSCIAGFFTIWATRGAFFVLLLYYNNYTLNLPTCFPINLYIIRIGDCLLARLVLHVVLN